MLNNFLSGLMFQYSFVLKSITCIIYLIEKETSSEKIEKLYELSLILKFHACSIVTQNFIERFSVTIDCVRFLIRGFPLYTYSMNAALNSNVLWCLLLYLTLANKDALIRIESYELFWKRRN